MVDVPVCCALLRYNFEYSSWEAVAAWDEMLTASGTTPDEAVQNLRHQCNKHDLWPKGV